MTQSLSDRIDARAPGPSARSLLQASAAAKALLHAPVLPFRGVRIRQLPTCERNTDRVPRYCRIGVCQRRGPFWRGIQGVKGFIWTRVVFG